MPSDITIVVADPSRMAGIRSGLTLPGRVLWFPATKLASAWDSIQMNHPKLIAVDALFAETPQGKTFLERLDTLAIRGSAIQLLVRGNGKWTTTPHNGQAVPEAATETAVVIPKAVVVPKGVVVAPSVGTNTRRADRFGVLDPLKALVEGGDATLINISILGAQVVSGPALRPNQSVKVALPDSDDMLHLTGHVAWSQLEQSEQRNSAYYRAGIEFTDATSQTMEAYCRRHCAGDPLPAF
jgi:hypothetical protein